MGASIRRWVAAGALNFQMRCRLVAEKSGTYLQEAVRRAWAAEVAPFVLGPVMGISHDRVADGLHSARPKDEVAPADEFEFGTGADG